MKITSRFGVLLAKIAGKEANLEHMVPPWATNAEEELMLDIADRIDQLEAGGGGGGGGSDTVILHIDEETGALDKTWQEIHDLLEAGKRLVFWMPPLDDDPSHMGTQVTVVATSYNEEHYAVWSFGYQLPEGQPQWYDFRAFADSASDYPLVD